MMMMMREEDEEKICENDIFYSNFRRKIRFPGEHLDLFIPNPFRKCEKTVNLANKFIRFRDNFIRFRDKFITQGIGKIRRREDDEDLLIVVVVVVGVVPINCGDIGGD